jgi:hypothetical protein
MKTEATGIVLGGALQLDEQLALPDHSRVRVAVETIEDAIPRRVESVEGTLRDPSDPRRGTTIYTGRTS